MTCSGFVSGGIVGAPFDLFVGGTAALTYAEQLDSGYQMDRTGQVNWQISDTSIATVNVGTVSGVQSGNVTISVGGGDYTESVYIANYCDFSPVTCPLVPPPASEVDGTVKPMNDFSVNAQSITDGDTGSFNIAVTNGTPSRYQWSFSVPVQGAGNNPNVNFTNATGAQTTTDGHWYAFPNASCPPADQPGAPARNSVYTITATVNFPSGNTPVAHTTTLSANFIWFTLARTGLADITGTPAMAPDSQGTWHVTGIGTMARILPVPNILVTPTSQFYNKTVQHEKVHVDQWGPGRLVGDLYIPATLLSRVANFTGTSEADLTTQYNNALQTYRLEEEDIFGQRRNALEHEAYLTSDALAPQFMTQNCGRY